MLVEFENISLRDASLEDAKIITTWWNDGRFMEHAGFKNGLNTTIEETIKIIKSMENKRSKFGVIEISKKLVGEFSIHVYKNECELGIKICDGNYQNKGYGTKILNKIIEFCFLDENINEDNKIKRVFWDTTLENKRAQHVYEDKVFARKVKVVEDSFIDSEGKSRTAIVYEVKRDGFFNKLNKVIK